MPRSVACTQSMASVQAWSNMARGYAQTTVAVDRIIADHVTQEPLPIVGEHRERRGIVRRRAEINWPATVSRSNWTERFTSARLGTSTIQCERWTTMDSGCYPENSTRLLGLAAAREAEPNGGVALVRMPPDDALRRRTGILI